MLKRTIVIASLTFPTLAHAELFKCSVNGKISYQDHPCTSEAQKMPPPKLVNSSRNKAPGILEGLQTDCTMDTIRNGWEIIPQSSIVAFCGEFAGVSKNEFVENFGAGRIETDKDNQSITRHRFTTENNDIVSIVISSEKGGVISGVITPSKQRERLLERREAADEKERERMRMLTAIGQKKIMIGMTKDQAKLSWGNPRKINKSSYGPEQWVYRRGSSTQYIYFEDGVVTAWN